MFFCQVQQQCLVNSIQTMSNNIFTCQIQLIIVDVEQRYKGLVIPLDIDLTFFTALALDQSFSIILNVKQILQGSGEILTAGLYFQSYLCVLSLLELVLRVKGQGGVFGGHQQQKICQIQKFHKFYKASKILFLINSKFERKRYLLQVDLQTFLMAQEHHSKDFVPVKNGPKELRYKKIREAMQWYLDSKSHPFSNASNLISLLKEQFQWWWVGFYWVTKLGTEQEHLILGQFQGPPACAKIFKGKGVCGTAWARKESIVLEDVDKFEGHIACSSASKSEIVIPLFYAGSVIGVLDIDAANYGEFNEIDEKQLRNCLGDFEKLGQFEWFAKNI